MLLLTNTPPQFIEILRWGAPTDTQHGIPPNLITTLHHLEGGILHGRAPILDDDGLATELLKVWKRL